MTTRCRLLIFKSQPPDWPSRFRRQNGFFSPNKHSSPFPSGFALALSSKAGHFYSPADVSRLFNNPPVDCTAASSTILVAFTHRGDQNAHVIRLFALLFDPSAQRNLLQVVAPGSRLLNPDYNGLPHGPAHPLSVEAEEVSTVSKNESTPTGISSPS